MPIRLPCPLRYASQMNQPASTPAQGTDPRSVPVPLLRIALPNKGRLAQDTRDLFNDAGLEVRALSDRALKAALGGEFEAIFVRAQDIPEFVSDGAADAGVTGLDLVRESRRNVSSRLDLGFGRCRLAVAARDDCAILSPDDLPAGSRIATAFPAITQQYFADAGLESKSSRSPAQPKSPFTSASPMSLSIWYPQDRRSRPTGSARSEPSWFPPRSSS